MTTFVEVVGDPPFRAINGVPGQNLPSGFQPNFLTTQPFAVPSLASPAQIPLILNSLGIRLPLISTVTMTTG